MDTLEPKKRKLYQLGINKFCMNVNINTTVELMQKSFETSAK